MKTRREAAWISARFGAFLEALPDAIVVVTPEGSVVAANQHTLRLFGYAREELIGQPIEILVPDSVRAGHARHRGAYAGDPHARPMGVDLDLHGRRQDGDHEEHPSAARDWDRRRMGCRIGSVRHGALRVIGSRLLCAALTRIQRCAGVRPTLIPHAASGEWSVHVVRRRCR